MNGSSRRDDAFSMRLLPLWAIHCYCRWCVLISLVVKCFPVLRFQLVCMQRKTSSHASRSDDDFDRRLDGCPVHKSDSARLLRFWSIGRGVYLRLSLRLEPLSIKKRKSRTLIQATKLSPRSITHLTTPSSALRVKAHSERYLAIRCTSCRTTPSILMAT